MQQNSTQFDPSGLVRALSSAYHWAMKVIRAGDKEVVKVVTPSGVTAVAATSIPDAVLLKFERMMERKLRKSGHLPPATANKRSA